MKEKIKYTDEPIGRVKVIKDFLPSPEELALKEETIKQNKRAGINPAPKKFDGY